MDNNVNDLVVSLSAKQIKQFGEILVDVAKIEVDFSADHKLEVSPANSVSKANRRKKSLAIISRSLLCYLIILLSACSSGNDHQDPTIFSHEVLSVRKFVVPDDSLPKPKKIPAGTPRMVQVIPPQEFLKNHNIHLAVAPASRRILIPVTCKIGGDGFELPKKVKAIENPFFCKAPEVVLVKDAYSKDINPQNFVSYSKLQGLRHDQIRSMIQDKMGNIWLGTDDGLTKYDGKYFSHYTTEQGLNNNLILSVFQDRKGNLWFGTFRGGVTKYDGKYLTSFTTAEGLLNNVVNCISEDTSGNMWFGTGGGLVKYDGSYFTNFTQSTGLCHNDVRSVVQDISGKIWISTNGNGISVFDGNSFSNYSENEGLIQNYISTIFVDSNQAVWLGAVSNGLMKYDGSHFTTYTTEEGLGSNTVRTILEDDEGNMWFGSSDGGISKYDGKYFTNFTDKEGLSVNIIRSSLKDKNGNLWFGTRGGGLTRFEGNLFTHFTTNEGLSNSGVMSILQDDSDNLWLGTFGGYVTKCATREVKGVKQTYYSVFGEKEGLLNSRIYSIIQDKERNIWFGTDGGGVSKFDGKIMTTYTFKEGLCNNLIRKIFQDRDGNFWFASYGSGISKFDGTNFTNYSTKEGLSSDNILSIAQDANGNMWFGTDGGGAMSFDGKNFCWYTKKQGFNSNTVCSIFQDRDHIIWFGTGGDGVVSYDGKLFISYGQNEGLSNNYILSILQDKKGNIWFGSRFGPNLLKKGRLDRIEKDQETPMFKSYSHDDGFIGIGCNLGAICEDKTGTIWIGTNDRLTAFHPGGERADTIPPNLQITSVQLYNEDIPWSDLFGNKDTSIVLHNGIHVGKLKFSSISQWYGTPEHLSLPHNSNYLTFKYIGIEQNQNIAIRYQYLLEGLDQNWNIPTDRTEASFGNLHHGNYIFKVKAVNADGYWSNEISFPFTIRPPWWATWWFYASLLLIGIILIYSFIKFRERRLIQDKLLLQLKVQEQTRELIEKNEVLFEQKQEIQEKNTAIERKNEELLKTNAEKDKFFSIIAHDLRSPFNGFLGLTQIMTEELSTLTMDEIQEIAERLNSSATNLFKLLENLLEWARIQQGLIPFKPALTHLKPIVNECVEMIQESAKIKDIEIDYYIPVDLEVFADRKMIQTVIRNLVSNAVKFTPKGGKINILTNTKSEKSVEISITDTGIGMSPKIVDNLFKPDVQTSRLGTEGESSTGLGLLLCKEFVAKHGGEIRVESEQGKGSTFYFTISYTD